MLRNARDLQRYTIHATDGDIGRVQEFYFDDQQWTIRHAVVSVGHWLPRHRVLVPTMFLVGVDEATMELRVTLARSQVASSPTIDTEKPVSRQHEGKLYWHYGFTGSALPPHLRSGEGDPHLRRTREVAGYGVHRGEEQIGEVDDFLVDDSSWSIRYMVMKVHAWWPGKKVLVPPKWIVCIRWEENAVHVALSRATVRNAPEYDPTRTIDADCEGRLHDHYERSNQLADGHGQPSRLPAEAHGKRVDAQDGPAVRSLSE
jgi:hypothetical protein